MNFLCDSIGVKLQANGCFLDSFGFGIAPVDHGHAVHSDADPVPLGQDLNVIPVVLLADFFRGSPADG